MLPLSCSCRSQIPLQVHRHWPSSSNCVQARVLTHSKGLLGGVDSEVFGQHMVSLGSKVALQWSFLGGSRIAIHSETRRVACRKFFSPSAFWMQSSQIASSAFTLGTIVVLPFYTLMVLAPKAALTRKSMESTIPYIILGILYAYLLYLSWTPNTIQLMFASKYWLPELPGIAKMFSREMTLASAWIHLLVVDLFAARNIFHDGLKNGIETRHSVSFCLLFCPIGILAHAITKVLTVQKDRKEVSQGHAGQASHSVN